MTLPLVGERWVVVCEEEVVPADTGCRVDHRGFLAAAAQAGVALDALVPTRRPLDRAAYAAALPGAAVSELPRDESWRRHLSSTPYVVASRPVPPDLAGRLPPGPEATAIISYSVRVAGVGLALAARRGLPHLVRCQNLDSAYFADLATGAHGPRRGGYLIEARKLRRYERRLDADPRITAFADVSSEEARAHRLRTRTPVLHVPSFALGDAVPAQVDTGGRAGVLFLGSLDVETNQQALDWLLGQVWPAVRAAVPDARLSVVGRRPPPELVARVGAAADQGVALYADVPDVVPWLAGAAVAVNPARTGSGINVKLLQGVAGGCASVSTTVGASGLDWQAGRDLEVADEPAAFAGAIASLLRDRHRREALAVAGAAHVRERLDPRRNVLALAAALGRLPAVAAG